MIRARIGGSARAASRLARRKPAPATVLGLCFLAACVTASATAKAEFECPGAGRLLSEFHVPPVRARHGFPCLKANLYSEAQGNQRLSGAGDQRSGYAFASTTFSLILTERIAGELGLALGAVDDQARTRAIALVGDYGISMNSARFRYSHGGLGFHVGAYSPEPALTTELLPGLYTSHFADDYYLERGAGAGAAWTLANVPHLQTVHLTVDAFATDQLVAGEDVEDWFVRPPAADTVLGHDYASVLGTASASYQGDVVNIRSRGAVLYQSAVAASLPDQLGASFGLAVDVPLGNGWTVTGAAEAARFRATGPVDHVRGYLAAGAAAAYRSWQVSLGYAMRERDVRSAFQGAQRDQLIQASLAYFLPHEVAVELGYRNITEYRQSRHEVGVRVTWEAAFGFP